MANDGFNWSNFFKGAAQVAFVVGAGYAAHRVRENEIDRLVALPLEDGLRVIIQSVPPMDNESCLDFQRRLAARAQHNQNAQTLLIMTKLMVQAENQVRQILGQYGPREAAEICAGVLRTKNDIEQFAFVSLLYYFSQRDAKAQAVMGYLQQG